MKSGGGLASIGPSVGRERRVVDWRRDGTSVLAFPALYASAFSGFYLP